MAEAAASRVRAPAGPLPPEVLDAARAAARRPQVRAAYLFAQDAPPLGPADAVELYLGVDLVPGARAAEVLPGIDAELRRRLPAPVRVGVLALSRRVSAEVRRHVPPLAGPDPVG